MARDLGFRGYDTVYLVQPVPESVSARLAEAAIGLLRQERIPPGRTADRASIAVPPDASDFDLIGAARRGRLPLRVAIAGDRIAVHLPHEFADGVEGTRLVTALVRAAAGAAPTAVERPLSAPLLRALASGGRSAVRDYLAGRRDRRALEDPGSPVRQTDGAFARVTLDADGMAALRRVRSSGGRATTMTRAASVVIAALVAVTQPSTDARVVLPADLRGLVGGRRVARNFVSAEAYGTLRGADWSPASINRMLAGRRRTGAVALAAATVRGAVQRAPGPGQGRPTISVSLMGSIDLPVLVPGRTPVIGCATVGTAAGTFVFVAQVKKSLTVSLWDDTGRYDVAAFPGAFRAEMDRRAS